MRTNSNSISTDLRDTDDLNHIVITYDENSLQARMYINGTEVAESPISISGSSSIDSGSDLVLGGDSGTTVRFGRFQFWKDRVLSSSDVSTLYNDYDALLANTYKMTITADSTLSVNGNDVLAFDFELIRNKLSTANADTFWNNVKSDGGDIRVYYNDGSTQTRVAAHIVEIDTTAEKGYMFIDASNHNASTATQ